MLGVDISSSGFAEEFTACEMFVNIAAKKKRPHTHKLSRLLALTLVGMLPLGWSQMRPAIVARDL